MSLKERRELVALHHETAGQQSVLFTLIGVRGSSYRRVGARMLSAHGRTAGTLSGGCLEADLLRRAAWLVRDGAVMEYFSTAFDDTAEIPYGLGCGGEVDLLLEPHGTAESNALLEALEATLNGKHRVIATCLPGNGPLARLTMDAVGDVLFASESIPTEDIVDLRRAARAGQHGDRIAVGEYDLFVEHVQPAQRVVLFGAGEDARPLARMALEMGWSVLVADGRLTAVRPERFPGVDTLLLATSAASLPVCREDAVVLMTHSYEQDRRLLQELLPLAPRYLGLLGARHRSALLLQEAAEEIGMPLATAVERTHAPVGLHLGGDGPEAVALAIVAELQQVLAGEAPRAARAMSTVEVQAILAAGPVVVRRSGEACGV